MFYFYGAFSYSAVHGCALSGGVDRTVRVWDVAKGRCLRVLEGHQHAIHSVEWTADHRRACSGDGRGGIRIWDLSGTAGGSGTSAASGVDLATPSDED